MRSEYFINEYGDRVTPIRQRGNGYLSLVVNGKRMYYHHYIWLKFHTKYDKIPEGFNLHHKDEDKLNNAIENLELRTITKHCQFHKKVGEFTEQETIDIIHKMYEDYQKGLSLKNVGLKYGFSARGIQLMFQRNHLKTRTVQETNSGGEINVTISE